MSTAQRALAPELEFWQVPRAWPGETCVVIGSGPSLTNQDVEYCRGKARVIAVNDVYKLAPWADVLHGCDPKWWKWHPDAKKFAGIRTTMSKGVAGVNVLQNTGREGFDPRPWCCRTGDNGGYQAVHIATHFGCSRILLLGLDHTISHGKSHYFGEHPDGIRSSYPLYLGLWRTLRPELDARGVQVINCSRMTAIDAFPRRKLEDVL